MPIYEYQCQECGAEFEKLLRSISSPPKVECPKCGSEQAKKLLSQFGFSMRAEDKGEWRGGPRM